MTLQFTRLPATGILCEKTGKQGYDSYSTALGVLRKRLASPGYHRSKGMRLDIYPCEYCRKYHIGTTIDAKKNPDKYEPKEHSINV